MRFGHAPAIFALTLVLACAPAAPSPTAPPPKPTEAPKPAAKPTEAPRPAAKPTEKPAVKVETKPTGTPSAKPAFDQSAIADFYRGKTVRIIVGFAPGGGYDAYSRLIARYLGRHLPGNPTVIVENMPGAGSMLAMNQVYNSLPKDGTVIGNVAGGLVLQQLAKAQGVEFDATRMEYLGAPSFFEYLLIVTRRSGFTSLEQMLGPNARQVVLGATGVGSGSHNTTVVAREALGINMRIVAGYGGSSEVRLAMERGEVDGYFNSWDSVKSTFAEQFRSGEFLALTQLVDEPIKDLPNVPMVLTFARTEEARQLLRYGIIIPNKFARPYVIAPGVPPERVAALQAAFDRTMADRDFLAEAEKAKQDITPITGPQLKKQIVEFLSMPPNVAERVQKALQATS